MEDINPKLSDLTNVALAYPGKWQQYIKTMDVLVKDLDAIVETLMAAGVEDEADLKLHDTSEIVIVYSIGTHRMRSTKTRVLADMPEKLVREIESRFRVV